MSTSVSGCHSSAFDSQQATPTEPQQQQRLEGAEECGFVSLEVPISRPVVLNGGNGVVLKVRPAGWTGGRVVRKGLAALGGAAGPARPTARAPVSASSPTCGEVSSCGAVHARSGLAAPADSSCPARARLGGERDAQEGDRAQAHADAGDQQRDARRGEHGDRAAQRVAEGREDRAERFDRAHQPPLQVLRREALNRADQRRPLDAVADAADEARRRRRSPSVGASHQPR